MVGGLTGWNVSEWHCIIGLLIGWVDWNASVWHYVIGLLFAPAYIYSSLLLRSTLVPAHVFAPFYSFVGRPGEQ
jgi:hypothetical protein